MKKSFADTTAAPILGAVLFVVILCLSIPGFASELLDVLKEIAR